LKRLGRGPARLKHFSRAAIIEYTRAFADPRTIHATCEDYRAAATIDLIHDKQDLRKKLRMPMLALWGKHGVVEVLFDCLRYWRGGNFRLFSTRFHVAGDQLSPKTIIPYLNCIANLAPSYRPRRNHRVVVKNPGVCDAGVLVEKVFQATIVAAANDVFRNVMP